MTSTRLPEVDGKYSSTTKISLKETHDLQQDRTAYDEYYRAVMWLAGYVPDDFPMQKVKWWVITIDICSILANAKFPSE